MIILRIFFRKFWTWNFFHPLAATTRLLRRRSRPHSEAPVKALHPLWVKPRAGGLGRSHERLNTPQFQPAWHWWIRCWAPGKPNNQKTSELPRIQTAFEVEQRAFGVGPGLKTPTAKMVTSKRQIKARGRNRTCKTERAAGRGECTEIDRDTEQLTRSPIRASWLKQQPLSEIGDSCSSDANKSPSQGLSLNRSQWGGCSTDYDTPTEN